MRGLGFGIGVVGPLAVLAAGWAALVGDPTGGAIQDEGSAPPRPTPQHELLARGAGVWDAEMKLFMGGPDAPPQVSKGVSKVTVLPGGLWVLDEFKGEVAGRSFEGRGQTGYDAKKGKFVSTWIDSMSPHLMVLEGTYDEKAKALTMYADGVDPGTGRPTKEKYVTNYKNDDIHIFTMSAKAADSKDDFAEAMEITYRRRKAS